MIDFKLINLDRINFNSKKTNFYIKHNEKNIEFYVNDTINVTPITCYYGKYNMIIKIDEQTKELIEKIENKFIEENNISKEDYIPIVKQNDKGFVMKLKVMNRYKKVILECFDEDKEPISYTEIEKLTKMRCAIHISNFWNYKGKYGLLVYAKKIHKLR